MRNDLLYHTLLLQIFQCRPRQASIDFEPIDEDSGGDESVSLDVFLHLLVRRFIEDYGVVRLVLDLALRPLLLLLLAAGC